MADRIGMKTVPRVPLACPPMQGRYLIGLLRHQARLQNVREEMMVAIPPAFIIQGNEKQVAAIEHLKPESIPEKDIGHIQLYKKSLVMSAIDSLAGYRFTKENYKNNSKAK